MNEQVMEEKCSIIDPCIDLQQELPEEIKHCESSKKALFQELWMAPIQMDEVEKALSCTHQSMSSRNCGTHSVYYCSDCGFWLDTSLASLEDALQCWPLHVKSWAARWERSEDEKMEPIYQ